MIFALTALASLLMIAVPFVLGYALKKRARGSWWLFGVGALTFVGSQLVHLPLLRAIALLPSPPRAMELYAAAAVAGIGAGLCEEWARYVAFRFVLRANRAPHDAWMFGAGHGGIEAIIVGVVVSAGALWTFAAMRAGVDRMGLDAELAAQVRAQVHGFARMSGYEPFASLAERCVALTVHVTNSAIVARAVRRSQRALVWLAIAIHAALNGGMILSTAAFGPWWSLACAAALVPIGWAILRFDARSER